MHNLMATCKCIIGAYVLHFVTLLIRWSEICYDNNVLDILMIWLRNDNKMLQCTTDLAIFGLENFENIIKVMEITL